jgi:Na+-transporting NADH:ubiquinone oxidoreductase subunit NqrF
LQITVKGLASQQEIKLDVTPEQLELTVLNFLYYHEIPVASSCSGEGICGKCVVNQAILSCQITLEAFIQQYGNVVEISYL